MKDFPDFSLSEAQKLAEQPNAQEIVGNAVVLADGALSGWIPTANGGILVFLEKRDPIDEAQYQKDAATQIAALRERKGLITFLGWLQTRMQYANLQGAQQTARQN